MTTIAAEYAWLQPELIRSGLALDAAVFAKFRRGFEGMLECLMEALLKVTRIYVPAERHPKP